MSERASLRHLLVQGGLVVAPGAYDCITARLVEAAGFDAVYMSGSGTAASLGFPDYGLTTMSELAANAARMTDSIAIPLIADADTGFGNELNVVRTVRAYLNAGVAALHIEDQTFPKRCGHLDDKKIVSEAEFVQKIRAAAYARGSADLLIIARTDARAVLGLDAAIARANAAIEAGADIAFVEAPESLDELQFIPGAVNGPCLFNMVFGGKTPAVSLDAVERAGYRLVIVPSLLISTAIVAYESALHQLKQLNAYPSVAGEPSVRERFKKFGSGEWDHVSAMFAVEESSND